MSAHGSRAEPWTAPPATVSSWRNAIMVLFALGGIALSTWGPRLPSIRDALAVGDGVIGLALAGVTVGSLAGLALSAIWLTRFGPVAALRGTVVVIVLGIVLIGAGAGIAGSLAATVVGFVVVGFGVGTFDVMINVQGAAVETAAGRTLMPLLHAAWSAGAVVGSVVAAGAAAARIAFQWQFLAEALLIGVIGLVATRYLQVPQAEPGGDAASGQRPFGARARAAVRRLLDPRLLLIGVVMFGAELGEGTANSWLSLSARDGHGQTETVAALFFTVFAVSETAARIAGGPIVDRVGRVTTVRVTAALGVLGLVLFILGGPVWVVLAGVVLWAFGVSMGFPLGMSAAADSGTDAAARVSAVAALGYLANLAGPPVIGGISERLGLLNSFWLVAVLLAVAVAAAGAFSPRAGAGPRPTGDVR